MMELKGSCLLCDTRPNILCHVISQWELRREAVHLLGIATKAAILHKIDG
jgi:hypothetical protein